MNEDFLLKRLNSIEEWLKEILRSIEELKMMIREEKE